LWALLVIYGDLLWRMVLKDLDEDCRFVAGRAGVKFNFDTVEHPPTKNVLCAFYF
jgi:hypothetical protein